MIIIGSYIVGILAIAYVVGFSRFFRTAMMGAALLFASTVVCTLFVGILTTPILPALAGIGCVVYVLVSQRREDARHRRDAARARSRAITFEQARAACVLADAGILASRPAVRRSRARRPIRLVAATAAAVLAAVLAAAPLVSVLAGSDVARAAASIVRQ